MTVKEAQNYLEGYVSLLAPGCKSVVVESGATRRASMDLTRALAEMRKS
jgi:hypothetical protein